MYPLKLRAGICAVCGGPIYIEIADPRHADGEPTVQRKFQAAAAAHFDTHPPVMQAGSRSSADKPVSGSEAALIKRRSTDGLEARPDASSGVLGRASRLAPKLRDAQPNERLAVLREVYVESLAASGDQDRRAVYTIDEALGSAATYRFWIEGHRRVRQEQGW